MPEPLSVDYGLERLTLTQTARAVLTRLLQRLPSDLWDIDPDALTLQRDLYHATSLEIARWLENRTLATPRTLLLEAEGLDLDRLLRDYGLRRYLQRPDAHAQQIGLHALYVPKATEYAIRRMADLLFDVPHVTLLTGPGEVHTFLAETRPLFAPYTFWRLVDGYGRVYAVTIQHGVPVCAPMGPPGLDQTPGGLPLDWFTVRDELHVLWYVAIRDDTFWTSATTLPGHGTFASFQVRDGTAGSWGLSVERLTGVLVSTAITSASPGAFWRVQSRDAGVYMVSVPNGVPFIDPSPALPDRDETPTVDALDWFVALDQAGTPWYVTVHHDTLVTHPTMQPGAGWLLPMRLEDGEGALWEVAIDRFPGTLDTVLLAPAQTQGLLLTPAHPYQAVLLHDAAAHPWWLSLEIGAGVLTPTLPVGATDVTPAGGPYRWLRLYDLAGQRWYAFPGPEGLLETSLTSPGGLGTLQPTLLGDARGIQWHYGIDVTGVFTTSSRPSLDAGGLASALILHDAQSVAWVWRVTNTSGVPFFEVGPAVWEDALPSSPWGSLSWITMPNDAGQTRYVFPSVYTGVPVVSAGPPLGAFWGWDAPITFVDQRGAQYALSVDALDVLAFTLLPPDDIPLPEPRLALRDFADAMAHVRAQGTIVTLVVA
jgi:hypothetical protein